MDEQPHHTIGPEHGSGKTDGLSPSAVASRAPRALVAFPLRRPLLADHMALGIRLSVIGPPAVWVIAAHPERREPGVELPPRSILPVSKDHGAEPAGPLLQRPTVTAGVLTAQTTPLSSTSAARPWRPPPGGAAPSPLDDQAGGTWGRSGAFFCEGASLAAG